MAVGCRATVSCEDLLIFAEEGLGDSLDPEAQTQLQLLSTVCRSLLKATQVSRPPPSGPRADTWGRNAGDNVSIQPSDWDKAVEVGPSEGIGVSHPALCDRTCKPA